MRVQPPSKRVAANIRAEMARQGLTQAILAKKLGRAQQSVSRRLSGNTRFTLEDVADFAFALQVPPATLLAELVAA